MAAGFDDTILVVIPVYRGFDETVACIESVLSAKSGVAFTVLAVNDCSPESRLTRHLRKLADDGLIGLHENAKNLGFVRSVNFAFSQSRNQDVILLNADTVVFDHWIDRLKCTAYQKASIGTVTPLSNNATILSYPGSDASDAVGVEDARKFDALCSKIHARSYGLIPTAVGFCMYIKNECLKDVGTFDAITFERGYAEENDFCLRARSLGWEHCVALDAYVYHAGEASFGKKSDYLFGNLNILNAKYGAYRSLIDEYCEHDPLRPIRRELDVVRLLESRLNQPALLVTTDLPGGTERFVQQMAAALKEEGRDSLIAYPTRSGGKSCIRIRSKLPHIENLLYEFPQERGALLNDLKRIGVIDAQVHHFLNYPTELFQFLHELDLPYSVHIHDYVWFCPRINCLTANNVFCDAPDVATCRVCVESSGSHFGKNLDLDGYLERNFACLRGAVSVTAPSKDCARRMMTRIPGITVQAVPHESGFGPLRPARRSGQDAAWRIGLLGAIGDHKGYGMLLSLANDARLRNLPLEFIVIGFTQDDVSLLETGKVFITGKYEEGEAQSLLSLHGLSAALFLSIWPETWCYTLSETWKAGIWPIALDTGAVAERIREAGAGSLLPFGLQASEYNDRILSVLEGFEKA